MDKATDVNQARMLGRLRRRARHELKVHRYTNGESERDYRLVP